MTTRAGYLQDTAQVFLGKASAYLAEGDLRQGAEKGWGAAARIVKAVAEQRGWRNSTHGQLFEVADKLVEETGKTGLKGQFDDADVLHQNFCEGRMSSAWVLQGLGSVETFVNRLEPLLE